ncbi:MAG: SDR family oxidoreductase [Solirubrobacterales bacterium]|nr:SDR family oxidoreductase [Solirubrobacterales bacterium]
MSKGWSANDIVDLTGRTAVVTGGNSGIGLITCRELARHGARVVLACRTESKGEAAVAEIRSALGPADDEAEIEVRCLDLASLESVREFAEGLTADLPEGLDLLINNAGVMAPPHLLTADGFELQFGTNHLGHFALTGRLFDALKRKPGARVVTVSSIAARMGKIDFDDLQGERGYRRWPAYGQSKLANLIFALDFQMLLGATDLDVKSMAAHPGIAATNLTSAGNDLDSGLMGLLSKPFLRLNDLMIAQDAEHGALPSLRAATDPSLAGGSYIGPDGRGERRGDPVIVAPRKMAFNREVADRLWQVSTDLTGVEYDFGEPA